MLINSGEFALPSRRKLIETKEEQVVLLDATECEIERPKKNRKNTILVRRKNTR